MASQEKERKKEEKKKKNKKKRISCQEQFVSIVYHQRVCKKQKRICN